MKIVSHTVKPALRGRLARLDTRARNLWLSWNFDAVSLFIRIDSDLWAESGQNPVKMLGMLSQEKIDQLEAKLLDGVHFKHTLITDRRYRNPRSTGAEDAFIRVQGRRSVGMTLEIDPGVSQYESAE